MRIKSINKNVTKATLAELSSDKDLKGFMFVGFWDSGEVTAGWTSQKLSELAFGLKSLEIEVNNEIMEGGSYD